MGEKGKRRDSLCRATNHQRQHRNGEGGEQRGALDYAPQQLFSVPDLDASRVQLAHPSCQVRGSPPELEWGYWSRRLLSTARWGDAVGGLGWAEAAELTLVEPLDLHSLLSWA